MEGRRHSVDVPITKALIALRRVRSLRDPSTNATSSKYSPGIEDPHWEANSHNAIALGFHDNFNGDEANGDGVHVWRSSNVTEEDKNHKQMPSDGCNEGSGCSCNDTEEISLQNHRRRQRKKKNHKFARVSAGDEIYGESPQLSASNRSIGSSISLHEPMDPCHRGCGLGSCWSRTPKYRDDDELPLLTGNACLAGGVSPYEEIPRSICQKFMPKSFEELAGQRKVATALLSAISSNRISSSYIFEGPQGTGKTCAARIFAAALNCLCPGNKKPCGSCQECALFFSGRSVDVKELDSLKLNRGESCMKLIKNAKLPPVCSRFKVYVVDECQMLNRETWAHVINGLEDIHRRVVFVMTTPNIDKLPRNALTMSRVCSFRRLEEADVSARLANICVQEGVDFDDEALSFMAKRSNGSLRDAEMMLDHLVLLGKKITVPLIYEVNGVISDDELADLLYLALSSDATNTVKRARELMSSRVDPLQLISQLANLIMDILAGKCPVSVSEAKRKIFGEENSEADMQQLSHALKVLSQTEKQLRTSKNQSTWLTAALLQLGSPGSVPDENGLRLSTRSLNPDGDFQSTSSTGESLKHAVVSCGCENTKHCTTGPRDLDSIWQGATAILASRSLRKFLYKRGKLASIRLVQGITVAELEFARPNHAAKAEKSWKSIASALQSILGYNVELRINLSQNATNDRGIFKKPSFGIFNCSRRSCPKKPSAGSRSGGGFFSEKSYSPTPSKGVVAASDGHEYAEAARSSSDCGGSSSQFSRRACCNARGLFKSIRNRDGNALSVGGGVGPREEALPRGAVVGTGEAADVAAAAAAYQLNGGFAAHDFNQESKSRKREYMKLHCWRSAMFPFRKVWNHKHQQRNQQLVDYAVHCAAAN